MTRCKQACKQCTKCGEVKPLDEFCRSSETKIGRKSRCKVCVNGKRSIERKRGKSDNGKKRYVNRDAVHYSCYFAASVGI